MSTITSLLERRLDNARNLLDERIAPDARARVLAVVDDPTPATWGNAHGVLLAPMLTLWQATLAASDYSVTRGPSWEEGALFPAPWPERDVPTVAQLLAGITHAVEVARCAR